MGVAGDDGQGICVGGKKTSNISQTLLDWVAVKALKLIYHNGYIVNNRVSPQYGNLNQIPSQQPSGCRGGGKVSC